MKVSRRICFGTMLATMVTGGVSYAQQNAQQQDRQDENAPAPQAFRAKVILGAKVSLEGNTSVGTVDDIVLDENGNVDYLIVANADGQLVTVPWDAAVFNPEQRVATVHITPEQFQKVPTYTAKQYPVYSTPAYRTQVYQHYGLTPGQSRRLIRRGGAVVVPKVK